MGWWRRLGVGREEREEKEFMSSTNLPSFNLRWLPSLISQDESSSFASLPLPRPGVLGPIVYVERHSSPVLDSSSGERRFRFIV